MTEANGPACRDVRLWPPPCRLGDSEPCEYFEKGTGPTVRVLGKTSGVSIKELYQLFPKGPAKVAARIAGIPKPRGCI